MGFLLPEICVHHLPSLKHLPNLQHAGYGTYFKTVLYRGWGLVMLLTGKVAVIFGGSGAIGSTVAQAMAREGAHVCLGARSRESLIGRPVLSE